MEAERSIVLQKKMILFLSLIIGILFFLTYGRELKIAKNSNIKNLIANNIENGENEILTKDVKYFSAKVVTEENEIEISDEKKETFAGDVINLLDEKESVANISITNNSNTDVEEIANQYEEETLNNIETVVESENVEQSKVETEDKKDLVTYKDLAEDNPPEEYVKVVEVKATAYCLCKKCCGKSPDSPYYGCTNSGIKIIPGTGMKIIAVDPNVIPLNSKVYVEGLYGAWDYGYAIAADTGSAIKDLKIDLYMDTHEEALQWGRKTVKVYILGE